MNKKVYKKLIKEKKWLADLKNCYKKGIKKPRELWRIINRTKSHGARNIPILPEKLFEHFRQLNTTQRALFSMKSFVSVVELDEEIRSEEVILAIKNMKANKSPGMDGIPPGIYKCSMQHWSTCSLPFLTGCFRQDHTLSVGLMDSFALFSKQARGMSPIIIEVSHF